MPGPAFPPKVSFETGTTTTKARGQETHRGSQPGYTPWRDLPWRKGSSRGPGGASVPPGAALRASAAGGGARERGRDGEDLAVARRAGLSGLPFGEVAILGDEAHREFVERSGLREDLRACATGGEDAGDRSRRVRILHRSSPVKGELHREILETLIELGAPWVKVVSVGLTRRGLGSI